MSNADRDLHGSVDPVCGMKVSPDAENRCSHEGNLYLFCSASCLGKFKADTDRYLNPDQRSTAASHPELPVQGDAEYGFVV